MGRQRKRNTHLTGLRADWGNKTGFRSVGVELTPYLPKQLA